MVRGHDKKVILVISWFKRYSMTSNGLDGQRNNTAHIRPQGFRHADASICLSGCTICTILILSNWCWRINPRVSRPALPAADLKQGVGFISLDHIHALAMESVSVDLAEKEGFEPSVGSPLRLISSQVHSTTLPLLRVKNWLIDDSSNH